MSLILILSKILGRKLTLHDGREVKIHQLGESKNLMDLLEVDEKGFRIATKSELEMFVRKYPRSRWCKGVLGIESLTVNPLLGIIAETYEIKGSWIEQKGYSVGELSAYEHVLLVHDESSLN